MLNYCTWNKNGSHITNHFKKIVVNFLIRKLHVIVKLHIPSFTCVVWPLQQLWAFKKNVGMGFIFYKQDFFPPKMHFLHNFLCIHYCVIFRKYKIWTSQFCHAYDHDEMKMMESKLSWTQFHKNEQVVVWNGWCCALQDQSPTTLSKLIIHMHKNRHVIVAQKKKCWQR